MKPLNLVLMYLAAALLFTYLFYDTDAGVNYLIFFGIGFAGLWTYVRKAGTAIPWPAVIAAGLLALSVFLYGTEPANGFFWVFWLAVPVTMAEGLYSFPTSILQGIGSALLAPFGLIYDLARKMLSDKGDTTLQSRLIRFGVFGVLVLFALIYLHVSEVMIDGLNAFYDWMGLLDWYFIPFFLLGLYVTASLFTRPGFIPLLKGEQLAASAPSLGIKSVGSNAKLFRQMLTGLTVLALLPALADAASLLGILPMYKEIVISADLHRSVLLLIFSCVLIAFLAGLLFSGRNSQVDNGLERAMYLFLAANVALLVVTAVKNGLYVSEMGLSFKRIGVFFWLGLVASGLVLTALMIRRHESLYLLIRNGSWAAALAFCSYQAMPTDYWVRISQMSRKTPDYEYLAETLSNNERLQLPCDAKAYPERRNKWQSFCLADYYAEKHLANMKN